MTIQNPKIKTKVVHSKSKPSWNIVGTTLGGKFKIAQIPYVVTTDEDVNLINKAEAVDHANFISECFNNSNRIIEILNFKQK